MRAMTRFPQVKSVYWGINDRPAEVTSVPSKLLWGEDAIEEELCGLRFRVRPNAFLQTNTAMAEQLYALAVEYADSRAGDGLRPLLRHRHDRPRHGEERDDGVGGGGRPRSPSPARSRTPS